MPDYTGRIHEVRRDPSTGIFYQLKSTRVRYCGPAQNRYTFANVVSIEAVPRLDVIAWHYWANYELLADMTPEECPSWPTRK